MYGDDGESYSDMLMSLLPPEIQYHLARRRSAEWRDIRQQRVVDHLNAGLYEPIDAPTDQPELGDGVYGGRRVPRQMPSLPSGQGVSGPRDLSVWLHNRRVMDGATKAGRSYGR